MAKMIQNKFLVLVITITIYTKSIYSNPATRESVKVEKTSDNSGLIGRTFSNIYDTVYKNFGKTPENDFYKPLPSKISYDPDSRKFFIAEKSKVSVNVHQSRTGRKIKNRKKGYFWDDIFDYMRGGLMGGFSDDDGRTPPDRGTAEKRPVPLKDDSKSEEESDDDSFGNFFDGFDNLWSGSSEKKPQVLSDEGSNTVKPISTSQSSEESVESLGLFDWLSDDDYSEEDEENLPENFDLKVTPQFVYTTTPSTTDYYENAVQYTTVNEEYYEPTEDISTTLFADFGTTIPSENMTMEHKDDYNTTAYEDLITQPTTTVTRKPTTLVIRRITTQLPYKPPTISYTQFVNTKTTKPPRRVVSNRPYSLTNVPRTTTMSPHVYSNAITVTVPKETIVKKDCVEKKRPTVHWFPQIFGTGGNYFAAGKPAAPGGKPTGWLSFLSSDDDDDADDVTESPTSAVSWFGSFFSEEPSTKAPVPEVVVTPTTQLSSDLPSLPVTTPSPVPSWFDSFLDAEEDDGAYANNITVQPVKKTRRRNYKGFQLLRVHPDVNWRVEDLKDLQEDTKETEVMWWSTPAVNKSADLLVPSDMLAEIKSHLNAIGTTYDVLIWDLQKAITYENPKLSKKQRLELERIRGHPMTWRRYHRYADILRYMEYLSLKYPDIVDLVPLGRSSEGLPIVAAKLSFPSNITSTPTIYKKKWKLKSKMKPAIWIDGGIHAREWISPAVATWLLHTLVEGEHGNGAEEEMLKIADWYILPVANPDGYEHTHTSDRLWKKTRSMHDKKDESTDYFNSWFPWNWAKSQGKECFGTDLNRNWDYHWGEKDSSKDPCSDYYAGPRAFSEPETVAISSFLMENKEQMKVYLSLQSYDQMWMMPTTHTELPFPDNAELLEMGKLALNALSEVYGTKYKIGSVDELVHPVSGAPQDWAKAMAGIKYSYAIKMRDSYGPYGFLLPGSQITPTAKETWEAIKTIADNL